MGKRTKAHRPSKSAVPRTADDARWTPSHLAAAALGGVALALTLTHLMTRGDGGGRRALSPDDLLARVRRSHSFDLAGGGNRTLVASRDITKGEVLLEIPRELMVWDLDAARSPFVQQELFGAPFMSAGSSDTMSKRAALLSAYLALLRNDIVVPSRWEMTSVAKAMPSYAEYESFHPVLADLGQMKNYLGEDSIAFLHLQHVRNSLDEEYKMLTSASAKFAETVSREDYLASRLAVQSRAFTISNVGPEVSRAETERYEQALGIDFSARVISLEPVIDWMNTHVNNNVRVQGYDAVKRAGRAVAIKEIQVGKEFVNNYGEFYDHNLWSQYGFTPADGSGTSIASLFVHHDMNLMGELLGEANSALPPLNKMAAYLRFDDGYPECITKESDPEAWELKRMKLRYLQRIALDSSRWVLPLPPRSSTDATPASTTALPDDYKVPQFGPDAISYLEENALSLSTPCRLITLTERDVEHTSALLKQDLEAMKLSANQKVPPLKLEDLEVSIAWMMRTVHCMKRLASTQMHKYSVSVEEQVRYTARLAEAGDTNGLEWNAAHVKLEEMQSQEVLENWALGFWDSIQRMEGVPSVDGLFVRDEPCPDENPVELIAPE